MDEGDPAATGPEPADPEPADVDRLLADLSRWMGDERTRAAADARARRHWLQQQAAESATFVGVALDLAERGTPVAVRVAGGHVHHGRIAAVGVDFVVVRPDRPELVLVATEAVASVRPIDPTAVAREPMGDRKPPRPVTLAQAMSGLAGTRRLVRIVSGGGTDTVTGELRSVGLDIVTVRVDGQPPATVYVRLGSVDACTVFGSG
jgi:hypothetical protein